MARFNYTNRKKIPTSCFEIELAHFDDLTKFSMKWSLNHYKFPSSAKIIVNCIKPGKMDVDRIDFGDITCDTDGVERTISKKDDNYYFDIKVIDNDKKKGQILGESKGVRIGGSLFGKESLIHVQEVDDLHGEIWRLEFDEEAPVLLIQRMDAFRETNVRDEYFISLVYPQMIRQILTKLLLIDNHTPEFDSPDSWRDKWAIWSIQIYPDGKEEFISLTQSEERSSDDIEQYINEVCSSFSKKLEINQQMTTFLKGR